jgi:hypothetical protein
VHLLDGIYTRLLHRCNFTLDQLGWQAVASQRALIDQPRQGRLRHGENRSHLRAAGATYRRLQAPGGGRHQAGVTTG